MFSQGWFPLPLVIPGMIWEFKKSLNLELEMRDRIGLDWSYKDWIGLVLQRIWKSLLNIKIRIKELKINKRCNHKERNKSLSLYTKLLIDNSTSSSYAAQPINSSACSLKGWESTNRASRAQKMKQASRIIDSWSWKSLDFKTLRRSCWRHTAACLNTSTIEFVMVFPCKILGGGLRPDGPEREEPKGWPRGVSKDYLLDWAGDRLGIAMFGASTSNVSTSWGTKMGWNAGTTPEKKCKINLKLGCQTWRKS